MSSEIRWMDDEGLYGKYSSNNSCVALNIVGAANFSNWVANPPWDINTIIYGDYSKWIANFMFVPFDITKDGTFSHLKVNAVQTDIGCYDISGKHQSGYTLGEYYYEGIYGDFRDYEPYSHLKIYLPYYGFVEIPIAEVMNRYIQFRLKMDIATGQAVYYIGVNNNSVTTPDAPFIRGINDTNTRIVGVYTFQLGVSVPIGSTGMADMIRNTTLGIVKGATALASPYAALAVGAGETVSNTRNVTQISTKTTLKNPKTNRQNTFATENKVQTSESERHTNNSSYYRGQAVSSAIESLPYALSSIALNPNTDIPNNAFITDLGPTSIYIVRKRPRFVFADADHYHLYGKPLGETKTLSSVHGYTEISAIHFEDEGLDSATYKELAMLEDIFKDGIILP